MRYWIRDEDETPQGFPLKLLFQKIIRQFGSEIYQLWLIRSEGYGLKVNEWGKALDNNDRILVDPELFLSMSLGEKEWFFDLDAEIKTDLLQVRFGLHDSTALYIETTKDFASAVVGSFEHVADCSGQAQPDPLI